MATYNFQAYEDKYKKTKDYKEKAVDYLRGLDTDINWESFGDMIDDDIYDTLKENNNFNIDVNNPNKPIYTKDRAKYLAEQKARELQVDIKQFRDKGFLHNTGTMMLNEVLPFNMEQTQNIINQAKEIEKFYKIAGVKSEDIPQDILGKLDYARDLENGMIGTGANTILNKSKDISNAIFGTKIKDANHKDYDNELQAYELYKKMKQSQKDGKEYITSPQEKKLIKQAIKGDNWLVGNTLGALSLALRDDKEEEAFFIDLQNAKESANEVSKAVESLKNVLKDEQFFGLLSNAETLSEKQQEVIKNYEVLAEKLGFDCIAFNKNGMYFIKDEKYYKVEQTLKDDLKGVLKDNIGSFSLGITGAMYGASRGNFAKILGYGALGAGLGGGLDSMLVDVYLDKDFDIAQALIHGSQEAGLNIAGDLVFKGVATTYKMIKGGAVKTDKGLGLLKEATNQAKLALSGQNMGAIDRALSKQAKKDEIPRILKSFQENQSNELIKKDFQNESLTEKILNKVSAYAPKAFKKSNEPSSLAQKRQELLSTALRNKDLADSLAGQLDDVEARILSEASEKMAKDFKALSQSYENLIAKEILKDEANPSLPKVFQKAVELAEHNVKTQYAQSVAKLESTLKDKSIDLLTPFKNVADYAIREFGANAEISRALIQEVNNLQGRNITIKEALEKRKDINAIIRNYNDNPNALKKFRFQDNALELKNAIDTQIHNTIESGIAKGELDTNAREVLSEFREANIAYADIKQRLNDKLTKAIFMNKPSKSTMNSMRSVDEWKKAVLDKQWQDSIVGLENTIFAKFDPRMQEHTQTLLIFRSLERHIKEKDGTSFIDLSKALKDIEQLESLPLHPQAQNALNIFKELAQTYEFMQKLSGAKGFKSGAGNGALATTLEGRMQVFMTNRLFKALFFRVPYIGDKDALLHHLKKAVQELKYPRAITLDMLQNPKATSPNPKSPSNPNGEAYINENVAKDIQSYVSNPQILTDELKHRAKSYALQNALTPPSDESILKAINDDTLIYTTIGNGKVSKEQVEKLKEILEKELPTKSNLEKDLTQQEIKETIDKWDLTKPNANDKLIISKVEQDELELLKKDFDFKGNYAVVREIDAQHLAHALNRHSDELIETSRNQIPITKDEVLDYQSIIKTHDIREVNGNSIVYKKQINGHYVAVEEVLTGKNKLRFVTMWKSKGNITTAPTPSSKGYDLDRTLSGSYDNAHSTTNKVFNQGDIKFDSLENFTHFAKLSGFENIPQEKLQSAHKYILENLHKLEC